MKMPVAVKIPAVPTAETTNCRTTPARARKSEDMGQRTSRVDARVWHADQCGVAPDGDLVRLLACVGTTSGASLPGGPAVYIARSPNYRPYQSTEMARDDDGYQMARKAFELAASPEMRSCFLASPLGPVTNAIVGHHQVSSWNTAAPTGQSLAELAAVAPRKGGETPRLWAEYRRRNAGVTDPSVAMRDFWTANYTWPFIRGSLIELDLAASMMCVSTAIDYVSAGDDARAGNHDAYLVAASEGFACLGGIGAGQAARDIVVFGASTLYKDELSRAEAGADPDAPVSPGEFRIARWWDGAIAPSFRLALGTAPYQSIGDRSGACVPAAGCPLIQLAFDSPYRYADVVDIVPDSITHESMNEASIALACGASVAGYASALAEVIDATLSCGCGFGGHEEAAELAMGYCLFFLLTPRYTGRRQLAAYSASGGRVAKAFAPAMPGRRVNEGCALSSSGLLYTTSWEPEWEHARRSLDEVAARVARRMTPVPGSPPRRVLAAAEAALAACDSARSPVDTDTSAECWQRAFYQTLDHADVRQTGAAAALGNLVARIWREGVANLSSNAVTETVLFIDIDQAVQATYRFDDQGLIMRRAFFGAVSSEIELAGLNPYGRLTDGVARLIQTDGAAR